ncbi:MAG TPA: hypothetical protein VGA67_05300 [Candidatus Dojkabacteria bacterium]
MSELTTNIDAIRSEVTANLRPNVTEEILQMEEAEFETLWGKIYGALDKGGYLDDFDEPERKGLAEIKPNSVEKYYSKYRYDETLEANGNYNPSTDEITLNPKKFKPRKITLIDLYSKGHLTPSPEITILHEKKHHSQKKHFLKVVRQKTTGLEAQLQESAANGLFLQAYINPYFRSLFEYQATFEIAEKSGVWYAKALTNEPYKVESDIAEQMNELTTVALSIGISNEDFMNALSLDILEYFDPEEEFHKNPQPPLNNLLGLVQTALEQRGKIISIKALREWKDEDEYLDNIITSNGDRNFLTRLNLQREIISIVNEFLEAA